MDNENEQEEEDEEFDPHNDILALGHSRDAAGRLTGSFMLNRKGSGTKMITTHALH